MRTVLLSSESRPIFRHRNTLLRKRIHTDGPSAIFDLDFFAELAGHDRFYAFQADAQLLFL